MISMTRRSTSAELGALRTEAGRESALVELVIRAAAHITGRGENGIAVGILIASGHRVDEAAAGARFGIILLARRTGMVANPMIGLSA
jgi:hypothetical protein